MLDQRLAPGIARLGVAQGIEQERHPLGDAELLQELVGEGEELDIGERRIRADDLGVELVELAEAALLRAFVAEGGAVRHDLQRRELLPAFREISAADAGGEFRSEEHTSELQSLMRSSYAVFCLKKTKYEPHTH